MGTTKNMSLIFWLKHCGHLRSSQPQLLLGFFFKQINFGLMVKKTILKWLGSLIPLKFLDSHHYHKATQAGWQQP